MVFASHFSSPTVIQLVFEGSTSCSCAIEIELNKMPANKKLATLINDRTFFIFTVFRVMVGMEGGTVWGINNQKHSIDYVAQAGGRLSLL